MKKIILFGFFLFLIFLFPYCCSANVKTYPRTRESLLVPDDVVVGEENISDIFNTPAVNIHEKIYDFTNVLTDSEKKSILSSIEKYVQSTNMDLVIVITDNLNDYSIHDYAYHFYDYNDFLEDGVILVVYLNEIEPHLFLGNSGSKDGKAFSIYTNSRIKKTLEYIYPDVEKANYYVAIDNYVKIMQGFFNLDRDDHFRATSKQEKMVIPWIEMIILSSTLTFIIIMISIRHLRKSRSISYQDVIKSKLDEDTLMVKVEEDVPLT